MEERVDRCGGAQGLENQGAFAGDANGVEDVEGVVPIPVSTYPGRRNIKTRDETDRCENSPQPRPPRRNRVPRQRNRKEAIPNNLRDPPSADTAQIGIIAELGALSTDNIASKGRQNPPDDQQSASDLHSSRQERRTHEAD